MTGNFRLKIAMDEHRFTQRELAKVVNDELQEAGERDSVGERTVRTWLTGKSRWPHRAKRDALEAVFRCTVEDLGFYPPGSPAPPQETADVIRRRFLTDIGGTAAAVSLIAARPSVGTSDVIRLRNGMDSLTRLDQARGGHAALERAALAGAREAVGLQAKSATQRVRLRLFSIAAHYTAAAAWSCIDARQLGRAQSHLDEALRLAGMGQDPVAQMRVWNATAILSHQLGDAGAGLAAAQAAQTTAITRRDPLFGSLAHARTAIGHAQSGDRRAATRSLGYAEEALSKAHRDEPRPEWIAFYGAAELYALSGIVQLRLNQPAQAEAATHRALAALPREYRRNRAMTTVDLALAQLHQGDVEQACATTEDVFGLMSGSPLPGRLRVLLGDFYRDLLTLAPSARATREWADHYRSEWSPA
ncbi:hypothetical protein [Streptomyces sp. NPDC051993]|uniref:hypothetical protein n=1 Tax=Streptomyces sp. NPDC051993 TaxID=3155286 RepID=UPI0034236E8E